MTARTGYELWRSDGTGAGTYLLADLTTGADPGMVYSSAPGGMATLGSWLVMVTGQGLARSDGTTAGSEVFWNGVVTSRLVAYQGALYFGVYDLATKEIQFWRTDATTAGTQQVHKFWLRRLKLCSTGSSGG